MLELLSVRLFLLDIVSVPVSSRHLDDMYLVLQEKDHLDMTVQRIEAHHPNVLLVEKTVSRYAQEILLNKKIALALNVKKSVLERIGRCIGAQVATPPDNLLKVKLGYCEHFHVEKYTEEHGNAGQQGKQKHLMFFENCPKPQGCTVCYFLKSW